MALSVARFYRTATLLWVLLALFVLRVLGQIVVELWHPKWLPESQEWFSGVMPYGQLLVTQVVMIALHALAAWQIARERGWFYTPKRWLGMALAIWGSLYLLSMITRYTVRMSLYAPERWTGGSIPIFFHCVLASYVLTLGMHHLRHAPKSERTSNWKWRVAKWSAWSLGGLATLVLYLAWLGYMLAPQYLGRELGTNGPLYAVRAESDVRLTTPDGTVLSANVFHPVRAGEHTPTILVRIPYSKTTKNTLFSSIVGQMWAEQGYTVVIQGTRGRYLSTGTYEPFVHEAADGAATLAWLKEQSWYNGRVGTWGGSYFGYTQWAMSESADPPLSAMMIQEASTDFHGMFYPGGAFSLESALYWALMSDGPQDVTPDYAALERGVSGRPLVEADNRAGRDIAFFNDWARHAERDDFWAEIDGDGRAASVTAPVLLMAGWYDPFLPTQLADYIAIQKHAPPEVARESRLIVGPWIHADVIHPPGGFVPRNYRLESLAPSIPWFERHLKQSPREAMRSAPLDAPVRIFVMGEYVWRDEQEWPPTRAKHTEWYLRGDGRLSTEIPSTNEPPDMFIYDPLDPVPSAGGPMLGYRAGVALQNEIAKRSDVLVYTSPSLKEPLEITGHVAAMLYVSTDAPCTDFTAKLVDVWPDGSAYNVCDGITRRRFDGENTTPTDIKIHLWPTSIVLPAGHRLRLEISSSNFPRFDANPNTGGIIATETKTQRARQTVFHDAGRPSKLVLPVIPRR